VCSSDLAELMEKLSQKEQTIEQLMKEGEALSVKELKLNDSIKKLKSKNLELEENLYDYSLKNEDSSTKLSELENLIKVHGFKSVNQLINEFNELSNQVSKYKAQCADEQSWEKKYQDQQKILENELVKSKEYGIQLNDMKISMDLIKQEHRLEIDSKNSIIESLKQDASASNQTYSDEISRLENKIESLRVEREYIPRQSNGDADTKTMEIEEFTKLSENHHNLQQQYLTSQENWKLIESNLLTKVDDLTSSVEMMKKAKLKVSTDFKRVNATLIEQTNKVRLLEENFKELSEKKEQLELELELKDNDYNDLQQKADTFKKLYESDKTNLNVKIKSLQETIDQMKKNELLSPKESISRLESGLSITEDGRNHSLPDIYDNPNWDMKYNDPLSTSKVNSQLFYDNLRNISENSLADDEEIAPDTFNDDSRSVSSHGFSHNHSFSSMANSGNNRNIQLINKMSAATRRLEVEIHTLKEENTQLTTEMEQMQRSLLEKYKLDDQMKLLNQQIDDLNSQLQQKNKKEETMLELIGEKTEQVEELRADVQDLKDLCKLQVQQMIEIQESK
jgi:chromosome segregation ATPase